MPVQSAGMTNNAAHSANLFLAHRPPFQPGLAMVAKRPVRPHGEDLVHVRVVEIAEPGERPDFGDVELEGSPPGVILRAIDFRLPPK